MITAATNVGALLDERPELVEFLAGYHPHFQRLRNRLVRRVMAPRVTLADAARMAGIAPDVFVTDVRRAVGEVPAPGEAPPASVDWQPTAKPEALIALGDAPRLTFDVRDELARGGEPFARIMAAVKELRPDDVLVLRTPFEPVPLYGVLARRGLAHWTERHAPDDWRVWFWHSAAEPATPAVPPPASASLSTLDVRGLEPPQPMVLVLERLEALAAGETLEVLHERRPLFLYPQLDARGFAHQTDEPAAGVVRIRIHRATGAS
jgi:uncharacterized protein (DUF2249 family)